MSYEVERLVHQCTVGDGERPDGKRIAAQIRKVVLLCLANTADHDGSNCKAWIDRLCRSAEVSSRSVRRALSSLEDDGFLVKVREPTRPVGDRAGQPAWYSIDLPTVTAAITARDDIVDIGHTPSLTQGHGTGLSLTRGSKNSDPRVPQGRSNRRPIHTPETVSTRAGNRPPAVHESTRPRVPSLAELRAAKDEALGPVVPVDPVTARGFVDEARAAIGDSTRGLT